jgi:hypothetical protein
METTVVRYKIKPDRVDENADVIKTLFAELRANAAEGVRYAALLLDDGTFIHIAQGDPGAPTISKLRAFAPYQAGLPDRLLDKPIPCSATVIDNYGMLTETALKA